TPPKWARISGGRQPRRSRGTSRILRSYHEGGEPRRSCGPPCSWHPLTLSALASILAPDRRMSKLGDSARLWRFFVALVPCLVGSSCSSDASTDINDWMLEDIPN